MWWLWYFLVALLGEARLARRYWRVLRKGCGWRDATMLLGVVYEQARRFGVLPCDAGRSVELAASLYASGRTRREIAVELALVMMPERKVCTLCVEL